MKSQTPKSHQPPHDQPPSRSAPPVMQRPRPGHGLLIIGHLVRHLPWLVAGGSLLVTSVLLASIWQGSTQWGDRLTALFNKPQPKAQIDTRTTVVQQIRGASELTTAIYGMETMVPTSQERTLGGYVIGKTTLLYIAYGEVRAGVNLATLGEQDIQINGNSLSIRLPPPRILDSKIDVNRSKVYDYDRGFLGLGPDAAPMLQDMAQRETLAKMVTAACTSGVLDQANERAKLTVGQLLATAGYGQVVVETQPPTPEACPTQAVPSPSVPTTPTIPTIPTIPSVPTPPVSTLPPVPATPPVQTLPPDTGSSPNTVRAPDPGDGNSQN